MDLKWCAKPLIIGASLGFGAALLAHVIMIQQDIHQIKLILRLCDCDNEDANYEIE